MGEKQKNKKTDELVNDIIATYEGDSGANFIDVTNLPVREKILDVLDSIMEVLFPGYTGKRVVTKDNVKFIIGDLLLIIRSELSAQIELALSHMCRINKCEGCDCAKKASEATEHLLNQLPAIRKMLKLDVQAAFDGDPAATSFEEVVISYPSISTIAIHRIAHELYLQDVPLIPRIMSENAHSKTGIDIHPGATIGKSFFIDHGTGVVVGYEIIQDSKHWSNTTLLTSTYSSFSSVPFHNKSITSSILKLKSYICKLSTTSVRLVFFCIYPSFKLILIVTISYGYLTIRYELH